MPNGTNLGSLSVVTDESYTATIPAGLQPGRYPIFVLNGTGWSPQTAACEVVLFAVPVLTSINVTSGPDTGGNTVIVTGNHFTNPDDGTSAIDSITFDGNSATSVTVTAVDTLTCVVPAGTGTVDVVVNTPGGADTLSAYYTYNTTASAPTLNAVSPSSGSTTGGFQVLLFGSDFVGVTSVTVDATSVTYVVDSTSRITIPSMPAKTAGSKTIEVTNSIGSDTISFTYAAPGTAVQTLQITGSVVVGGAGIETRINFGARKLAFTILDDRELIGAGSVTTALQTELINAISSDKPLLLTGFTLTVIPALLAEPGRVVRASNKTVEIDITNLDYDLPNGTSETLSFEFPENWIA